MCGYQFVNYFRFRLFTNITKFIVDEREEINYNLSQLYKCISVDFNSFFDKILNRQTRILDNLDKHECNEPLEKLLSNIFKLQVKVWKKASNCLRHKNKLSDRKNENLKNMFDYIKALLNKIEEIFKTQQKI